MELDDCGFDRDDHRYDVHVLHHLHTLTRLVQEGFAMTQSNQEHLNADVTALGTAVATVIAELKAQAAAGQPLDFTAADALVASTQAEATADAPPAPPAPAPADPTQTPVDGTAPTA